MIGYFVLLQLFVSVAVQGRPNHLQGILQELVESDANLNVGFDLDGFRQNQLNLHNYYRSLHGVPPMTVNATLTSQAQEFAERLASLNGGLTHCSNMMDCDTDSAGENLAMASGSTTTETNATKKWYDEIWDYDFCSQYYHAGNRPGHEGKDIGHFTQVVWKGSTQLGIGYARNSDKTKVYVVGRYLPAGNVAGQYNTGDKNVPKPNYIFNTFSDNCYGTNGGFSAYSLPGECSRSCGGGVQFKTRTCTNPKPSLNGRDCVGTTKTLASLQWCNLESCSGDLSHRALQCQARGKNPKAYESSTCTLYCQPSSGGTYWAAGTVDDGTHCNSDAGVCVAGVCESMATTYVAPTQPPPTSATGAVLGEYNVVPSSSWWTNNFFTLPVGATDVVVTNNDYNNVDIAVGYQSSTGAISAYTYTGTGTFTVIGVSFTYNRPTNTPKSTITFSGGCILVALIIVLFERTRGMKEPCSTK